MAQISTLKLLLAGAVTVLLAMLGSLAVQKPTSPTFGSVVQGNEMIATTTSQVAVKPTIWSLTATSSTDISAHQGALGSFVQVSAAATLGNYTIFDATTTNANLRAASLSTSTILLASLPTNASANTYTFDVVFKYGLIVVTDGTTGTTTITYRIDH